MLCPMRSDCLHRHASSLAAALGYLLHKRSVMTLVDKWTFLESRGEGQAVICVICSGDRNPTWSSENNGFGTQTQHDAHESFWQIHHLIHKTKHLAHTKYTKKVLRRHMSVLSGPHGRLTPKQKSSSINTLLLLVPTLSAFSQAVCQAETKTVRLLTRQQLFA